MRKTLEELNAQYVPNNASTNFTNSTCRKRLLNRFIGEGKWQYIYEGKRVVAVEIIEDEVVNEIEDEIELCYTSIKAHESEIEKLKSRIKQLEEMLNSKPTESVKDVFKGINFRKYSWRKYIYDNYTEITTRYESHKHLQGIESEYTKVMNRFLVQAARYIQSQYRYSRFTTTYNSDFDAFDKSNWNEWYKNIYDFNYTRYDWEEPKSCENFRDRFTVNMDGLDFSISEVEQIVGMFSGFSGDVYDNMVELLNQMKEYKCKATECNAKSDSMFDEFCFGYQSYEQQQSHNTWDDFWSNFNWGGYTGSSTSSTETKYFTGCTTKQEIKKRYRELAKELHPDHGGNQDEFIAMKNEYDRLMKHAA